MQPGGSAKGPPIGKGNATMKIKVHTLAGDDSGGTWGEAYASEREAYDALLVDHLGESREEFEQWAENRRKRDRDDDIWAFIDAHKDDPSLDTYQIEETTLDFDLCAQPLPATGYGQAQEAVECLRRARDLLKAADNKQTLARVEAALSSAKGAVRIQRGRETRLMIEYEGYGAAARRDGLPIDSNPISTKPEFAVKREHWNAGWRIEDGRIQDAEV